jgi:hypothetical protein
MTGQIAGRPFQALSLQLRRDRDATPGASFPPELQTGEAAMRYLAAAVAALFLFAAPGASFAQDNGNDSNNANAPAGANNGGGDNTGSPSRDSRTGSCSHIVSGQKFDTINEECRREIRIWLDKQNDAGVEYKGDLAVGSEVPRDVVVTEVPAYPGYGYARLNGRRVLIDRETNTVVNVD